MAPVLSGVFLFAILAGLSLPGLAPFVSEFLALSGTFQRHPWAGVIGTLSIVLAALYMLILYQRTMTGPTAESVRGMVDLNGREKFAVVPLIALHRRARLLPQAAAGRHQPHRCRHADQGRRHRPRAEDPVGTGRTVT